MHLFYEKLRLLASTESFLKSSDFEYSNFLATSLSLKIPGIQKLRALCTFSVGFARNALWEFLSDQGAFHALRPKDLWRRPDFFVGKAASFLQ